MRSPVVLVLAAALAACSSGPTPPDWQLQARPAIDAAIRMDLDGDTAGARREFERGRALLARTGSPALVARAELMRCAARVASLDFAACDRFERWRADAPAAEQAYADHLAGKTLDRERIALLPPAQRAVAAAIAERTTVTVQAIEDPQSRLIAAALLLRARLADPATLTLAADTASAQGWRRPLLAWLEALAYRAEQAGAADEAQRLRRRIELVLSSR
ncbi:MAG: hypothetical protein AB7U92_11545 [Piscinibacter sp.]|uniref:hypothetical protein n=1 Tax=Piscinibacter sp. TaxID=1903157 RepID=UPI003D0C1A09